MIPIRPLPAIAAQSSAGQRIAKPAAYARYLMNLLADIRMIRRALALHGLGIDTNEVTDPALRDFRRLFSRTIGAHRLHPALH